MCEPEIPDIDHENLFFNFLWISYVEGFWGIFEKLIGPHEFIFLIANFFSIFIAVTGNVYHLTFNPPTSEEVAQRLVQRSDDNEQPIRVCYREFQFHINSIRSCYEDKMIWVDGAASKDSVTKCASQALLTDALSEGLWARATKILTYIEYMSSI
jgi:hypothetical protein